ncbi:hypothetical protein [Actinomycetospora chibensis]|uniref:DUF222 domain-containing protein n=1 Tax=Actinomycetospora chibensis TaxID=663606 RepID=A0ABV9RED1_9PSEU|nr:hypothetical protein [Actinomycetospora chibensis]MDD7922897.1 hypothetical protein [Actinomycetospora chibensis]
MGQLAEEFAGGGVDDAHVVIDRATPATAYTARPKAGSGRPAPPVLGRRRVTAGEGAEADQALVERVRARLEQDGQMIRGTEKSARPVTMHRAAQLAVEELTGEGHPITWTTARTRPRAISDADDPRDVLIGRLAVILGVADGGHHPASFDAVLSAAQRATRARVSTSERTTP